MEGVKKFSSGYHLGPPWSFRGSALYQLHLVKAETARAFIPKEFKLVEAFGYTLGGLFLAEYDDSPAGKFDELVVIAGIVWNPPTSCAWAARVLVSSHEACWHGRKEIGLPSHVAIFSKKQRHVETMKKQFSRCSSFLSMLGVNPTYTKQEEHSEIEITEIKGSSQMSLCNISLPFSVPKSNKSDTWMGPRIRMSLPSFSGQTEHNPHLLKYSCQIECRVRAVKAAKVSNSRMSDLHESSQDNNTDCNLDTSLLAEDDAWKRSISILLSKPILALEFNLLKMQVGAPRIVVPGSKSRVTYANAS
ncbi:protein NEOXANTHIN-DEFICIENT 1 isoform X1 [Typha latifolia]|uniref:protein NEOXANTHIN-DEFICIENT 1 isoform X1 n=1 Tax=Typha latifolia TaxID=4733 RepID=UPI003C2DFF18